MADFITSYRKLAVIEGGYSFNPLDRGKETYKGISRKFNPNWEGWKIIDAMRKEPGFPRNLQNHPDLEDMVKLFYVENHWEKIAGGGILHQEVADEMFDTSVNMGSGIAVGFAQAAVNFLNKNGKLWPDIETDSRMGRETLSRINAIKEVDALTKLLNILQGARYINIIQRDPTQEEFLRGWLKRV